MTYIPFRLKGQLFLLSPDEADKARMRLEVALAELSHASSKIEPPELIDGFLTRESCESFFRQFGVDASRSGVIFNLITKMAANGRVPFNATCEVCGRHASQPCLGKASGTHNPKADKLRVEAASLVRYSAKFLGSPVYGLGDASRSNFQTLVAAIEDAGRE